VTPAAIRVRLLSAALALAAAPAPAFAASPQDAARERGEEGLRLFKAEQWEAAYAAFARADELFHAPTLVLYMARCRQSQGRLIEASKLFDKVAAEPVPPNAPEAFKRAVANARSEGDAVRARIPRVRVSVSGPGAPRARVLVDGRALDPAERASGKKLDPGEHVLAAESDGGAAVSKTTLREGESPAVDLALQPEQRLSADGLSLRPADENKERGSIAPMAIAFGAGGAGILAGAITGGLALSKIGDAHAGCAQSTDGVWHCPVASKRDISAAADSVHTLAPVSAVCFAVGGAAVVTGVILALTRSRKPASTEPAVSLDLSPTWIGARGRF
jgi:hypothetical protein